MFIIEFKQVKHICELTLKKNHSLNQQISPKFCFWTSYFHFGPRKTHHYISVIAWSVRDDFILKRLFFSVAIDTVTCRLYTVKAGELSLVLFTHRSPMLSSGWSRPKKSCVFWRIFSEHEQHSCVDSISEQRKYQLCSCKYIWFFVYLLSVLFYDFCLHLIMIDGLFKEF